MSLKYNICTSKKLFLISFLNVGNVSWWWNLNIHHKPFVPRPWVMIWIQTNVIQLLTTRFISFDFCKWVQKQFLSTFIFWFAILTWVLLASVDAGGNRQYHLIIEMTRNFSCNVRLQFKNECWNSEKNTYVSYDQILHCHTRNWYG